MSDKEMDRLAAGRHADPHRVLGRHGDTITAWQPSARQMRVVTDPVGAAKTIEMDKVHPSGIFEAHVPDAGGEYQLEAVFDQGGSLTTYRYDDAYRSWPTIGDVDLHLFGEGRHHRLWEVLGAHPRVHDGMAGVSFAVWAPNAKSVRVVGDWNFWDETSP